MSKLDVYNSIASHPSKDDARQVLSDIEDYLRQEIDFMDFRKKDLGQELRYVQRLLHRMRRTHDEGADAELEAHLKDLAD